jgi:outer membrane protein TolC
MRTLTVVFLFSAAAFAETRTLTLKEAVDLALKQSPDLLLARLDEQRAEQAVRIARDPFTPKVVAGSGLAYTTGFPMSIEGSSPSIIQARVVQSLYNRPQSYQVALARENARTASLDSDAKRDEVVLRTAVLYVDAQGAARMAQAAWEQCAALEKVAETIGARVTEGRELQIEKKRAALNLARARARAEQLRADREYAEESLATVLGLDPSERVQVSLDDARPPLPLPESEEAVAASALEHSHEIRRLESALLAKGYELRSHKAARLPTMDLVAQYGLFARFNNYEDYFQRFERHNAQIGVSFQLPFLAGSGPSARAAQAEIDAAKLRTEMNRTRNRISTEARRAFQQLQNAQAAAEVARLDLDVAREQLSILLAQMSEGRATLRQVEEARFTELEKWLTLYDTQSAVERARYELLRYTGDLVAALR